MFLRYLENHTTLILNTKMKIVALGKEKPLVCPVCQFVLRDKDDVKSVIEETACGECVTNFKYLHLSRWTTGWRPSIVEARKKMHI